MSNIRDVAKRAGVSLATASRVLGSPAGKFPVRAETLKRVREAAEALGYHVNYHMKSVSTGRADAIGYCVEMRLVTGIAYSDSVFFDTLRRGVEFAAQESGAGLMSIHSSEGRSAISRGIEFVLERRLDALVMPGTTYQHTDPKDLVDNEDVPMVVILPVAPIKRPSVVADFGPALRELAGHLSSLGHRHVLWLGPDSRNYAAAQRQHLFVQSAWELGMSGEVQHVTMHAPNVDTTMEEVRAALSLRLAELPPKWTAVVAYNDVCAVAACSALASVGLKVPEDISVTGVDNHIAEYCQPPLTSIDHRFYELGMRAGQVAAELVKADEAGRRAMRDRVESVQPTLVIRQSTAAARAIGG